MCGLAGVFSPGQLSAEELRATATAMARTLVHRGPDDEGVWSDPAAGVALGFRRLSILDLSSAGHQPMTSPSGRFVVVFNGELYNHREVRSELEAHGFRFRGHSDTETLVCALDRWGTERAVPRFNGMFAIAIWDRAERRLTLARDRVGKKPLYYFFRPGLVTFGSELKALFAGPQFDRALSVDAVIGYLRYLYVPAPRTIFSHAYKLPPGHTISISDPFAPLPDPVPYWSLDEACRRGLARPLAGPPAEIREEAERLLQDAVGLRLESDVPLGALLSGGIDSSLVVALMQRAASAPVRSFSIGFDDEAHDESRHAARVAAHLGTDHTPLHVTAADALDVVPRLPEMFDEPLADPSQIPTYLVSALARREVTVALCGDGGDELFAGYNRYTAGERLISRAMRAPSWLRRLVAAGVSPISGRSWDRAHRVLGTVAPAARRQRLIGSKVGKMARLLREDSVEGMYRSLLSAALDPASWVRDAGRDWGPVEEQLAAAGDLPFLAQAMLADQATYLPDDLLAKVDRASMAASLEVRAPLLDYRVVELSWRLPSDLKIRGSRGKWLLREILHRYVPRELVDRPKVGFSVPLASWLRRDLREYAESLLSTPSPAADLLDHAAVRSAWSAFLSGDDQLALPIWSVVVFQAWAARWLG